MSEEAIDKLFSKLPPFRDAIQNNFPKDRHEIIQKYLKAFIMEKIIGHRLSETEKYSALQAFFQAIDESYELLKAMDLL